MPPSVFLDANVLFSRTLRDWICVMALNSGGSAYRLHWSEDVLAEWIYKTRRKYPHVSDLALGSVRRRLEAAFPDAIVRGYTPRDVPTPTDPQDWHVVAAAASVPVDMLVTSDRRLLAYSQAEVGFDLISPDVFLVLVGERHPKLVQDRWEDQVAYLASRSALPHDALEEAALESLCQAGARGFAALVRSGRPTAPGRGAGSR